MFKTPHVAARISNIVVRQMEKDDAEIPLVELTCEVSPFTATLAGDLHDFVKRTLYTAAGVEVNSLLGSAAFNIEVRPQAVEFRMAPDQDDESFTLAEVKISGIKAKRTKLSTAWILEFKLTASPASANQLQQIVEAYLKTKYLSFENAAACLFDTEVDETPRVVKPRRGAAAAGESAATH